MGLGDSVVGNVLVTGVITRTHMKSESWDQERRCMLLIPELGGGRQKQNF